LAQSEEQRGFLCFVDEEGYYPDYSEKEVSSAAETLKDLEGFLKKATEEFQELFFDQNNYKPSLVTRHLPTTGMKVRH